MRQSKKVKWIYYFLYNNLCQMQCVLFLNIITIFFQRLLLSGLQAFWSHLRRKFSLVTEATYVPRPYLHGHWQIFVHARLLLVAQTCDNTKQLGTDCMWGVGEFQISYID